MLLLSSSATSCRFSSSPSVMPRIPEIFPLDRDDDAQDFVGEHPAAEDEIPDDHVGRDPWLEALEREAAEHVIQGNPSEWRCVRCDSNMAVQTGLAQWTCTTCSGSEFYKTDRALRRQTDIGTWMFLPRPPNGPPPRRPPYDVSNGQGDADPMPTAPISRRQRQRLSRALRRGRKPPVDALRSQSPRTPTYDPTVDPDAELPGQRPVLQPDRPTWRPTARPTSCPATPPTASSQKPKQRAKQGKQAARAQTDTKEVMTSQAPASSSSAPSWNSLMGPSRGVRWRGGT